MCKFVCGLWANITKVILLCNVGSGRSRQHCIAYFPVKIVVVIIRLKCFYVSMYLSVCPWANIAEVIFCIMLPQMYLNNIDQTYTMLSHHGQYNIVQVIFLIKVVCQPWTNIEQVKPFMQCCPRGSRQHCTGKIPDQCCFNTFDTTQQK